MCGTLFCYLLFFTSASTLISLVQTQSPYGPCKFTYIYIGDNKDIVTGQSTFTLQGRLIANITIGQRSEQNIKVTSGGIGSNNVTFEYNFEVSTQDTFYYAIYADDDAIQGDDNGVEKYVTKLENERRTKSIQDGISITIADFEVYNGKNDSRTESTSHKFDNNVVWNCYGTTDWDGKGSTEVQGGIAENQISVRHEIPVGFGGTTSQYCDYVEGQVMKRELQPVLPRVLEAGNFEDEQRYGQFYGTVTPGTFREKWFAKLPGFILNVDGGITWKNGEGNVAVNGGVGANYLEVTRDDANATSYGTFQYDISYLHTT